MPKFLKSLFGQVLLALLLGVLLGFVWPEFAVKLKPLGDGFIKLIKMIIPVLVFCVVVHGIAGAGDLKRVGRVGVKALIYFEAVTTVALLLGLVLAFWFQPGVGMNVDPAALDAKAMSAYADNASKLTGGGTVEFLMKLIPTTEKISTMRRVCACKRGGSRSSSPNERPIWPMIGWGIGLGSHAMSVYMNGEGIRDRLIEEELEKLRRTRG